MTHDVTDPMAPLGWQRGDPACKEDGLARFDHEPGPSIVYVQPDPDADHDHVYEKPPKRQVPA